MLADFGLACTASDREDWRGALGVSYVTLADGPSWHVALEALEV